MEKNPSGVSEWIANLYELRYIYVIGPSIQSEWIPNIFY